MARLCLGHAAGTSFTIRNLNGRIPIRCWRFDLRDAITAHFHDGDWNSLTVRTPWPSSGADSN